jgi:flavin-binding protein dodecin
MSSTVYRVIELIGSSPDSWEAATANAVTEAARTHSDLRVAEVIEQDVLIEDGRIVAFRAKVRLSFKRPHEES